MAKKSQTKLSLDSIGETAPADSEQKTPAVRSEMNHWQAAQEQSAAEHERLMNKLKRGAYRQVHEQRKEYAGKLFQLVAVWLAVLVVLVFASGWNGHRFRVSDSIILAMLGGTTVTVLGLFTFVAKYLFPDPASRPRSSGRKPKSISTRNRPPK